MATTTGRARILTELVTIEKPEMTIEGYVVNNIETVGSNLEQFVAFFGIPYAKPPIEKSERFLPPQPFVYDESRHGKPFKAIKGSKMCAQLNQYGLIQCDEGSDPMDCLNLNIYVPKKQEEIKEPLAVMVYFHGGGFYQGSGNYDKRTPESMMRYGNDVILVTVNYRLGPFGFLNLQVDKCRGNAGLKDQVQALKWVRDNIKCFKGDPGNVTIWGESAGGSCVNFHMISPLSKGLFHKAIIQSGGIFCPWGYTGDQKEIKEKYERYGDILERKHRMIIDKLSEAEIEDILAFHEEIIILGRDPNDIRITVGPSIEKYSADGAFLPQGAKELIKIAKPVPMLVGITSQEGYMAYEFARPVFNEVYDWILDDEEFRRFLKAHSHWEDETIEKYFDDIRRKYFNPSQLKFEITHRESPSEEDESQSRAGKIETPTAFGVKESLANLLTDLWFYRFYDNIKFGGGSQEPTPTYIYEFDFVSRLNPSHSYCRQVRGASHGDDIAYLLPLARNRMVATPFREDECKKLRTMCSLWASFARTSIPESACSKAETRWLPHFEERPCYMYIGEDLKMREGRVNGTHWPSLRTMNEEDEELKADKFDLSEQNTVAAFQTTLGILTNVLRKARSESALHKTATTSESSTTPPETANLGSCPGDLEHSTFKAGPSQSTLEVPTEAEDSKRHSPSRSPTSTTKTSKDESVEAKRGRTCEEDESEPHGSS